MAVSDQRGDADDTPTYAEQWLEAAAVLRAHAAEFEKKAEHAPSVPHVRRSGAFMECGCWWHAFPGSAVGFTKQQCPLHGMTMMAKANVEEPSPIWLPMSQADRTL